MSQELPQDAGPSSRSMNGLWDNHVPNMQPNACSCASTHRNLIVCIDGTSDEYGKRTTNVLKLYSLVAQRTDPSQEAYYHSGIGTYKRSLRKSLTHYAQVFKRPIDLAVALTFENTIIDAYRWLSEKYEKGDRIFLFGYSRGAYQVRTLSAMIDKVGLIHRNNEWQIPLAYDLYTNSISGSTSIGDTDNFKAAFARNVKVHFVGAWDTVSSVGLLRGNLLPNTINGMTHVCYFRHALALDERRVKFLPEYASGAEQPPSPRTGSNDYTNTLEVWFAGTHSQVGGKRQGGVDRDRDPPLHWMLVMAKKAGLRFAESEKFEAEPSNRYNGRDIKVNTSLNKWYWWLQEYLPLPHPVYKRDEKGKQAENTTWWPHRGRGRIILKGQKIHPSVWMSRNLGTVGYSPRARLRQADTGKWSDMQFWNDLQGDRYLEDDGAVSEWKEVYLPELMDNLISQYISRDSSTPDARRQQRLLDNMRFFAGRSGAGWQALARQVLKLIRQSTHIPADLLTNVLIVLDQSWEKVPGNAFPVGKYKTVRLDVLRHLPGVASDPHLKQIATRCLVKLTDTIQVLTPEREHSGGITSVAFSPEGTIVVSGSRDGEITFWDNTEKTWELGSRRILKSFAGHSGAVNSIVFSQNGKRIASGSEDRSVRVWDVEKGAQVQSFQGHVRPVRCVAFSQDSDGRRVISGSEDNSIRVWDVGKDKEVHEFIGHTNSVYTVAVFQSRIISGSEDRTVRIWDIEAKKQLRMFTEHCRGVRSVAFSSNGRRAISGSDDYTVRIWDVVGTRHKALKVFRGYEHAVLSVAFHPDGKRALSGSSRCAAWIWDAETQAPPVAEQVVTFPSHVISSFVPFVETKPEEVEAAGEPVLAGEGAVNCIAFSHDGSRVVSGSDDKKVRIWDIMQDPI